MNCNGDSTLISDHDRRGSEGNEGILHATERETWRKNDDLVRAPDIRNCEFFKCIEILFEIRKFFSVEINVSGFTDDTCTLTKRYFDDISSNDSKEVRWDRNITLKRKCLIILF